MTQQQLDRELATTLGEDLREIRRLGFSVADPLDVNFDPEPDLMLPNVIDWDQLYGGDKPPHQSHQTSR